MNKPALLIQINKSDENSITALRSVVSELEVPLIILDTRRKIDQESIPLDFLVNRDSVIILHATKKNAPFTGLNYLIKHFGENPSGVILVDLDQQFNLIDILTVADAMDNIPDALIIGGRRSNTIKPGSSTLLVSQLSRLIGSRVEDFNSGLRGVPGSLVIELLKQKSKTLDVWLELYVLAEQMKIPVIEVTVQAEHSSKSPALLSFILNSSKVIYIFLRFSFISLVTAGIDYTIFSLLVYFSNSILLSMIIARITAGSFQFFCGKKWVFKSKNRAFIELIKYILLVGILMLVSYLFITLMVNKLGINTIISKMIAELSLFIVSFTLQKKVVFAKTTHIK